MSEVALAGRLDVRAVGGAALRRISLPHINQAFGFALGGTQASAVMASPGVGPVRRPGGPEVRP